MMVVMIGTLPVLTSYLDESSDQRQQVVVCVAACLATDQNWKKIADQWLERLAKDGVVYFRTSSSKSVTGPFFHLRKKYGSLKAAKAAAAKIREDLEGILLKSALAAFMLGVIQSDYKEILSKMPDARGFFSSDPLEHAYSQVMYEITRTIRKKAKGYAAAFVIDQSLDSRKIFAAYSALRENHPSIAKTATTVLPLDDRTTVPLQVADLIASVAKDIFLEWLSKPSSRYAPIPERWMGHIEKIGKWDKAHFLRSLSKTLSSPRLVKGTLARRQRPQARLNKSARKRLRKMLTAQIGERQK